MQSVKWSVSHHVSVKNFGENGMVEAILSEKFNALLAFGSNVRNRFGLNIGVTGLGDSLGWMELWLDTS